MRRDPEALSKVAEVALPLGGLCYHDGACLHNRKKTRGPQAFLVCQGCEVQFHKSCVQKATGVVAADPFFCGQSQQCERPLAAIVEQPARAAKKLRTEDVPVAQQGARNQRAKRSKGTQSSAAANLAGKKK